MSGYSGTPQARKLGLKAGQRVTLDEPPGGWSLREPPDGLRCPDTDGAADLIIAFFRAESEITARLPSLARRVFPAGAVWAAWPRRAAGHVSDITDNVVRDLALELGLVDVKVAAIDEDWSGLRLVWRVSNRLYRYKSIKIEQVFGVSVARATEMPNASSARLARGPRNKRETDGGAPGYS